MDYQKARKSALFHLCRMSYHSVVLARKLAKKGFSEEVIDQVLQDCRKMGLLNDEEAIVKELRRGYGPRYIAYKLQIPIEEVRSYITFEMQKNRALELFAKAIDKEKAKKALVRKGFDWDIVIEIFS